MEAAIVERLRRSSDIELHSTLMNAPLIYSENGVKALKRIYQEYIDIAFKASLPILLCTPTWRANQERVKCSDYPQSINRAAVRFMKDLRDTSAHSGIDIKIGGLLGCKNDCYQAEQGLSVSQAHAFHSWQITQLTSESPDYLIAETLPNIQEAIGIAKAMDETGLPYIISFVITRDALVMDGTTLVNAIDIIDSQTQRKPLGYMVNCAYPSFIRPEQQPSEIFERLIGYQANASSLDHCELDNSEQLHSESVSEWGDLMHELNKTYGVKILGGCCGTNGEHLQYVSKDI